MTVSNILAANGGKIALSLNNLGHLTRSNAGLGLLLPGSADFVYGFLVYLTSKAGASAVVSVFHAAGDQRAYMLYYNNSTDRFDWILNSTGAAAGNVTVTANNFGSPPLNTWMFVECGRISGNSFIRVNRGTSNTATFAGSVFASTGALQIGGFTGGNNFTGRIDEGYFWTNAGGNSLPTSGDLDAIYNSGDGISWGELLDLELTLPYAAWSLEEPSGTRYDRLGNKPLTPSGTVTITTGLVATADYTLLQTWGIDLASGYDGSEDWDINIYDDGDFLGGANYSLSSITPGAEAEPVTIRAAEGHSHNGNPASGAFTAFDLTIGNCNFFRIDGLRFEGSDLNFECGPSNLDFRATRNLFNGGLLQVVLSGVDLSGLLLENNLCLENPAFGILVYVDAITGDASLTGAKILHNTIIGAGDGDYGIEVIGAESVGAATIIADVLNNVVIGAGIADLFVDDSNFTTFTVDQRGNATSDASGEVTGLAAADVFVDPEADDYETKVGGPTYRAGVDAETTIDILSRSRNDTTPDIGAFENPAGGVSKNQMLMGVG